MARVPAYWRAPLVALAGCWLGLIALLHDDWLAMARQWWGISTYAHVVLVPPIVAWLVVVRRRELARLRPVAWWPGLVFVAGAALLWVLGSFAGLSLARQLAAIALVQGSALTLLGPKVGAGLAFPLAYLLFLVPAGDELVPLLQLVTARLTTGLLGLSGIPALLDGVFITTPAGFFEVAEACSGAKFLIAMIAYGVLVAHVCFRRWPRRLAFLAVSVTVPVLANAVRAWGTIVVAGHRGIAFAAGFDHILYGWIFFAVVIAVTMAIGWRFFDRAVDDPMLDAAALERSPLLTRLERVALPRAGALAGIAALVLAALAWSGAADRLEAAVPARIALPEAPGWTHADYAPQVWWEPRASGAAHRLLGRYENSAGERVDVFFALYSGQDEGREAGGFGEGALTPGTPWAWSRPGDPIRGAKVDRLLARGPVERVAATFYRTDGLLTGSNARLKLANIADKLLLRRRTTALLIVSAEERDGHPAQRAIEQFLAASGPAGAWMDRIGRVP